MGDQNGQRKVTSVEDTFHVMKVKFEYLFIKMNENK